LAGLSYLAHAGYQVEFAYRTGEAMVVLMRSGKIKKKFGGRTLDEAVRKAVRYVLEMRKNVGRGSQLVARYCRAYHVGENE